MRTLGKLECTIGDVKIAGKREPDDVLDSYYEFYKGPNPQEPVLTLRPQPRVSEKLNGSGSRPALGCDPKRARAYVASSFLGYVVAYRLDGRELWRKSLPGFATIIGRPLAGLTPRAAYNLIESEGSILSKIVPMGSLLAVAYRVKGRWHQIIFHRSGEQVAEIGPWDGVLVDATSNGWLFDAGGESAHGAWKLPVEELALQFTGDGPDALIEHFLTWNLPRPSDSQWTWRRCDGDNRLGRLDLGPRFDPKMDEIARQVHDGLGTAWAQKMAEDTAMEDVLFRGDRPFAEWKASVRAALIDAGADVDCVNYAREHGLTYVAGR